MTYQFSYGGHSYELVPTAKTWSEAKTAAEASQGYLAMIESQAENQAIVNAISALNLSFPTAEDGGGAAYVWLGASDRVTEGNWLWVNGSNVSSGYQNWGKGSLGTEPDDFGGAQDSLALGMGKWPAPTGGIGELGQWNDVNSDNKLYYLIEKNSTSTVHTGGSGIDSKTFSKAFSQYTVTRDGTTLTVTSSESTEKLVSFERLIFADQKRAFDLDGNAGTVAKILAATFGAESVKNAGYVGIGLKFLDEGGNATQLAKLAIDARVGVNASAKTVVETLYFNVVGTAPSAADLNHFQGLLDSGAHSAASLTLLASDVASGKINLTGLAQTGLEFV